MKQIRRLTRVSYTDKYGILCMFLVDVRFLFVFYPLSVRSSFNSIWIFQFSTNACLYFALFSCFAQLFLNSYSTLSMRSLYKGSHCVSSLAIFTHNINNRTCKNKHHTTSIRVHKSLSGLVIVRNSITPSNLWDADRIFPKTNWCTWYNQFTNYMLFQAIQLYIQFTSEPHNKCLRRHFSR